MSSVKPLCSSSSPSLLSLKPAHYSNTVGSRKEGLSPNLNSMRPGNCWVTAGPTQNITHAPLPASCIPVVGPTWLAGVS